MADVTALQDQINNLNTQVQNLQATIAQKETELNAKTTELNTKTTELNAKTVEVENLQATVAQKETELNIKTIELNAKAVEVENLQATIAQKETDLDNKDTELIAKVTEAQNLRDIIVQKEEEIDLLKNDNTRVKIGSEKLKSFENVFTLLPKPLQQDLITMGFHPNNIGSSISQKMTGFFITNFNRIIDELDEKCQNSIKICQGNEMAVEDFMKKIDAMMLDYDAKNFLEEDKEKTCSDEDKEKLSEKKEKFFSEKEKESILRIIIEKKEGQEELEGHWTQLREELKKLYAR